MLRNLVAVIVGSAITPVFAAEPPPPITISVRITATADGALRAILFEGKPIVEPADKKRTRFDELTSLIRKEMETVGDPDRFEIVIDADEKLKYESVISTIQAVLHYRSEADGKNYPLAKKVQIRTGDGRPVNDNPRFKLPKPK